MSHFYGQKETQLAEIPRTLDIANKDLWSAGRLSDEAASLEASLRYTIGADHRADILQRLSGVAFETEMRSYEAGSRNEHVVGEAYNFAEGEFPETTEATNRLRGLRDSAAILSQLVSTEYHASQSTE